jgi:TRAP-type C4-dicarboxylate transport system permease small subunit
LRGDDRASPISQPIDPAPRVSRSPPVSLTPPVSLVVRALRISDRIFLGVAALLSAGYLLSIAAQVFYRYILEVPSPWTEEMARYLFIWSAFLAAAVSVGRNDQFLIPVFVDNLPPGPQRVMRICIDLLQLGFALVMLWFGLVIASRMMMARSPVLPIPQGLAYMVIPIAGGYMAVHLLCRLLVPGLRSKLAW